MDITEILKEYEQYGPFKICGDGCWVQYEKGRNRWLIGCMQSVNEAVLATIEMITMQEMSNVGIGVRIENMSRGRIRITANDKYDANYSQDMEEHENRLNLYKWYKEISK